MIFAGNVMHPIRDFFKHLGNRELTLLLVLLAIPAFLLHLGVMAFIGDEGIRTLVAFEMDRSGNYLVPTLNGQLYFNKPPLYNWMILGMSKLMGQFGEWPTRLTTLVWLAIFALVVYRYARKHMSATLALTQAAMLLTSGRILLWDSMLGLIDIAFSTVIFLNFMVLYELGSRNRWRILWPVSYALFAIAFLFKGLPAVVFQGISVAVALTFFRQWRTEAIGLRHLAGIVTGLVPLGIYYGLYATAVDLREVFAILVEQSMQRTPTHHTWVETIAHLFTFPFEQVYHFLPWSLLVAVVFHPAFRHYLKKDPFIRFCFWMLVLNLPVYWISAQVYPRYLLMFVPLFNIVGLHMLEQAPWSRFRGWYRGVFLFLAAASLLGTIGMPWIDPRVPGLSHLPWAMAVGVVGLLVAIGGLWTDKARTFFWMAIAMLVVRIVFDAVVLPLRAEDSRENACRTDCRRTTILYGDRPWYMFGKTYTGEVARCYTSLYTGRVIPHTDEPVDPDGVYIVDQPLHPEFPGEPIDSLLMENRQVFALMRIMQGPAQ